MIASAYSYRRGTNWIPLLLAVSIAAAGVMIAKPAPTAWWPPPVTRTILLLERIH